LESTDKEWDELQNLSNLFEPLSNFNQMKHDFQTKIEENKSENDAL